jgi:hypothetical protein
VKKLFVCGGLHQATRDELVSKQLLVCMAQNSHQLLMTPYTYFTACQNE